MRLMQHFTSCYWYSRKREAVWLNMTTVTLHSCSEREPGSLKVRNVFRLFLWSEFSFLSSLQSCQQFQLLFTLLFTNINLISRRVSLGHSANFTRRRYQRVVRVLLQIILPDIGSYPHFIQTFCKMGFHVQCAAVFLIRTSDGYLGRLMQTLAILPIAEAVGTG